MPQRASDAASDSKIDKVQLGNRMYFDERYTEIVRVIGYGGFPFRELDDRLKPLAERFGKDKIHDMCRELMTLVFAGKEKRSGPAEDAEVRLKPEVRKLAWQLLGPPPEHKPVDMIAQILARGEGLKGDEKRKPPKKSPRKKEAASPAITPTAAATTPILEQYREAKERHPGMLLLFRMGDFYELFDQDAETAAKALGLTLTSRDKTISMAGFPHHSLETCLRKLLQAGHRVAICDEVKETLPRGPIRREVQRVLTPGSGVEQPS